jgi:hypothetical protein
MTMAAAAGCGIKKPVLFRLRFPPLERICCMHFTIFMCFSQDIFTTKRLLRVHSNTDRMFANE